MTNLLMIIQAIMKCQKSNMKVEVLLKNNQKYEGYIQKYTGQELVVDGIEISIHDIQLVQECVEKDLSAYVMNRILIDLITGEQIDAVLIESNAKEIQIINDQGQNKVALDEIVKIVCNDEVILENVSKEPETLPLGTVETYEVEEQKKQAESKEQEELKHDFIEEKREDAEEGIEDTRQDDAGHFVLERFQTEDQNERNLLMFYEEEPKETESGTEPDEECETECKVVLIDGTEYIPNAFEQALINGNKMEVEEYITSPDRLLALGYTEKEAERLAKMYKTAPWGMEAYKIATRIYHMQMDKNDLARVFFEEAFADTPKSKAEYKKLLIHINRYRLEDGKESFVNFWKENIEYLKENAALCNQYIGGCLKLHDIKINEFEKAVIDGGKELVKEYILNHQKLEELGYSEDDIERIGKAFKITNWDTGWYATAARLFAMQLNKNNLAEIYYEAALIVADEKSDEYSKILNVLASLKTHKDSLSYIAFFQTYKGRLKLNTNYCVAYANALLDTQNWEQIEKDMPLLSAQLANNPAYLEKLHAEVEYYKAAPDFTLSKIKVLQDRYEAEEVLF